MVVFPEPFGPDVAEDLALAHLEVEVDQGGAERLPDVPDAVALGEASSDEGRWPSMRCESTDDGGSGQMTDQLWGG